MYNKTMKIPPGSSAPGNKAWETLMKRNLRFYAALFFAKGTALVLKLIGRKGTSMPGSWAIILCKDFLARMPRPKTVVMVAGTNGKTTVSNLIEDVLSKNGVTYCCNRDGANVNTGIASSLIADSTFFGKPKRDLAIFEFDERSAPLILPFIKPDIFLCTNLCRDALDRNANVDFIVRIINENLWDGAKLLVNGDDLIASHLKPGNSRVCFGVDELPRDSEARPNLVRDIAVCPRCDAPLEYDFLRYNHIGRAHCSHCDFGTYPIDYDVKAVDYSAMTFTLRSPEGEETYRLPGENITDLYNTLTAVTFLREWGLSYEVVKASLETTELTRSRYDVEQVGGKEIIFCLAKGQSPIASSRVFDFLTQRGGKSAVILLNYDSHDQAHSSENIAWLYEVDYEFLANDCVAQLIPTGNRCYDYQMRGLLAGIPQERIQCALKPEDAAALVDLSSVDRIYILHAVFTVGKARQVRDKLIERIQAEGGNAQ